MLFDENPSKLKGKSSPLNLYARLPNIKLLNVYARLPTIIFLKFPTRDDLPIEYTTSLNSVTLQLA